jgi:hypothetical protein
MRSRALLRGRALLLRMLQETDLQWTGQVSVQ